MNKIYTQRLILKPAQPYLANEVLEYYVRNKEFLKPYEAKRNDDFFTLEMHQKILAIDAINALKDSGYRFYIVKKSNTTKIIGTISISNIIRGCFQSALLGYKLDCDYINQGMMTEALTECIRFAFEELNLHRLEANIMPHNICSLKVVEKLGFVNEGIAKNYLQINGEWQDHVHMCLINQNYKED